MKGIDLFTQQATLFRDFDDFFRSPVGLYLEKVYGLLEFHPNAQSGLLKVSVNKSGKFIISENCYHEYLVDGECIGYIYPSSSEHLTHYEILPCQSGVALSRFGVVMSYLEMGSKISKRLRTGDYEFYEPEEDLKRIQESHHIASTSVVRQTNTHETYQILVTRPGEEFYWSNGHMIPRFFDDLAYLNRINIEKCFNFNPWIVGSENNDIAVQKMITGDEINRHSDTLPNETDRHIIYSIHWLTDGPFIGRELIVGKRTKRDLARYIMSCLEGDHHTNGYCSVPEEFDDTFTIKPEDNKGVILNAFNPLFYHGVAKMDIGSSVYTISDHFKLPL